MSEEKHSKSEYDDFHDDGYTHNESHFEEEHRGHEEPWLVSYADMMTLLFGFFVIMYTFASAKNQEAEEWYKIKKELATYFGGEYVNPSENIAKQISRAIEDYNLKGEIEVRLDGESLELIMQSKVVFESGSAAINEIQIPMVSQLLDVLLASRPELYSIVIEGHTDDAPIKNEIFRSNWDLSAARAATVAMMFQDKNYDMKKLSVRAFGEFKPALPNRDANGVPILENRNKNRRIVIRLVSLGLSEK